MEFLKKIFGEKALTFAELETALKDNKDIKLANLADGGYVGKDKFDTQTTELSGIKSQLANANKEIESYKGMDIDGIKKSAEDYKKKFEESETKSKKDLADLKFNHALEAELSKSKAKNSKAVRSLIDAEALKLQEDGTILGLKEQIEKIKQDNDYMFESDEKPPTVVKGTGGGGTVTDDAAVRSVMGLSPTKE